MDSGDKTSYFQFDIQGCYWITYKAMACAPLPRWIKIQHFPMQARREFGCPSRAPESTERFLPLMEIEILSDTTSYATAVVTAAIVKCWTSVRAKCNLKSCLVSKLYFMNVGTAFADLGCSGRELVGVTGILRPNMTTIELASDWR